MLAQITPPRDLYMIVVTGAMNPLVHTPQFYRSIGAINEEALQASLKMPLNSTTAALSQFQFGAFTITCQPTQWWIQSTETGSWTRMLEILSLAFGKLGATPVSGYWLLSQRHIETAITSVKSVFAASIDQLKLGFPIGNTTASSIERVLVEEDYTVATAIQPSVLSEKAVYVFYQRQFVAPSLSSGTVFELGLFVRGRLEKFNIAANKFFDDVVVGIESKDRKE